MIPYLKMISNGLAIPLLNRKVLERLIRDEANPSTASTDKHPVRKTGLATVCRSQTQLAETAQSLIRLHHAESTGRRRSDRFSLEHLLQSQGLGLTAGRAHAEPTEKHQPKASESSSSEQQPETDHHCEE